LTVPALDTTIRATPTYGIDKSGGASDSLNAIFSGPLMNLGMPWKITKITFPFGAAIAANMTITPTIVIDTETTNSDTLSYSLPIINNTNYPNGELWFNQNIPFLHGKHDFYLKLAITGTVSLPLLFPITIEGETLRE